MTSFVEAQCVRVKPPVAISVTVTPCHVVLFSMTVITPLMVVENDEHPEKLVARLGFLGPVQKEFPSKNMLYV